jgi:uncharacterized membrane protein SpoIIM required for sporulation
VRLERFVRARSGEWEELERLLARAGGRPDRLPPDELMRLGALYRAVVADVAYVRRAHPGVPVARRLERLALLARTAVYGEQARRNALWPFLSRRYWRLVRELGPALGTAAALLLVPMALATIWGIDDPVAALGIVPEQFRGAAEPGEPLAGRLELAEEAQLSSEILTNNIAVSFVAIAGGLLVGLGTAAIAIYNGGLIGALCGIAIESGDAGTFFALVVPHGLLELSLIVVSAAAGLRLGWAIVEPGIRTRAESLRAAARPTVEIVLGTMPWFVLAGLVEGFVTGAVGGLAFALGVGVPLAGAYWALVRWRGAPTGAPAPSR